MGWGVVQFVTEALPGTGRTMGTVDRMSGALTITVELDRPSARLALAGRLDSETIGSLVRCLASIDADYGTVVLDLADLEALDADAMHALVSFREEMQLKFQRLRCQNAVGDPARMLAMAGVSETLSIR